MSLRRLRLLAAGRRFGSRARKRLPCGRGVCGCLWSLRCPAVALPGYPGFRPPRAPARRRRQALAARGGRGGAGSGRTPRSAKAGVLVRGAPKSGRPPPPVRFFQRARIASSAPPKQSAQARRRGSAPLQPLQRAAVVLPPDAQPRSCSEVHVRPVEPRVPPKRAVRYARATRRRARTPAAAPRRRARRRSRARSPGRPPPSQPTCTSGANGIDRRALLHGRRESECTCRACHAPRAPEILPGVTDVCLCLEHPNPRPARSRCGCAGGIPEARPARRGGRRRARRRAPRNPR